MAGIAHAVITSVKTASNGIFAHLGQRDTQVAVDVEHDPDVMVDRHNRMVAKHHQIGSLRNKGLIKVADLMTEQVAAVNHDALIGELRALMNAQRTRHLLVQEDGLLIGIVSDRDLVEKRGRTAVDVMTPDPVTASPSNPLADAVKLLLGRRISCLPVVDRGRPCGIITTTDLLMALQMFLESPQNTAMQSDDLAGAESDPTELACAE